MYEFINVGTVLYTASRLIIESCPDFGIRKDFKIWNYFCYTRIDMCLATLLYSKMNVIFIY